MGHWCHYPICIGAHTPDQVGKSDGKARQTWFSWIYQRCKILDISDDNIRKNKEDHLIIGFAKIYIVGQMGKPKIIDIISN